jgi:hypothetical protein
LGTAQLFPGQLLTPPSDRKIWDIHGT